MRLQLLGDPELMRQLQAVRFPCIALLPLSDRLALIDPTRGCTRGTAQSFAVCGTA